MHHPLINKLLHITNDDNLVYIGGFIGGYDSIRKGLLLLPDALIEQLPNWINYSIHCVIGGVISLTIKKVFDKLFNTPKNDNNG